MTLDYTSSVEFVDQDIAYMNVLEVDFTDQFSKRKAYLIDSGRLDNMLNILPVPLNGKIIEAGIWKGHVYSKLKEIFGTDRCLGFDCYDYLNNGDTSVVIKDFRNIGFEFEQDVALFFNGMGGWDTNYTSKRAGLDYSYRNLIPGGFYIDNKFLWDIASPDMSFYPDFEEIAGFEGFIVYRKI